MRLGVQQAQGHCVSWQCPQPEALRPPPGPFPTTDPIPHSGDSRRPNEAPDPSLASGYEETSAGSPQAVNGLWGPPAHLTLILRPGSKAKQRGHAQVTRRETEAPRSSKSDFKTLEQAAVLYLTKATLARLSSQSHPHLGDLSGAASPVEVPLLQVLVSIGLFSPNIPLFITLLRYSGEKMKVEPFC